MGNSVYITYKIGNERLIEFRISHSSKKLEENTIYYDSDSFLEYNEYFLFYVEISDYSKNQKRETIKQYLKRRDLQEDLEKIYKKKIEKAFSYLIEKIREERKLAAKALMSKTNRYMIEANRTVMKFL